MISPEWLRIALLAGLVNIHQHWRRLVNTIVPDPYLDEVFHIPQAQAYWAGRWTHWDDKITTPPALYGFSYVFNVVRYFGGNDEHSTTEDLRFVNVMLLYFLLVALYLWTGVARKSVNAENVLQREFTIIMFPLFFFFSGLYYTDIFSALTVVLTYTAWEASKRWSTKRWLYQPLQMVLGALSLASRQTNIFWGGILLGGLQVIDTVKENGNIRAIHDPDVSHVWFDDIPYCCTSLVYAAIFTLPRLVLDLWPQIVLLASFTGFVVWNGGVVLGDKTNHIATIHLPQLLYIWPFIVFFSWPILLPQLADLWRLKKDLPRPAVAILTMSLMTAAVHFNTIVHPFTLADNRHYCFYVFRILTRRWWVKYLAVPIYYFCAWLVINALGTRSEVPTSKKVTSKDKVGRDQMGQPRKDSLVENDSDSNIVRLSFVLVWFASTALSLITAPLVEPRYFIVPWLIWRLHVPEQTTASKDNINTYSRKKDKTDSKTNILQIFLDIMAEYSLWIELAWYLMVNYATCWMFLYKGFAWLQEPDKVQRFMW